MPLPTTPTAWAAPLWATTVGVLLVTTVFLHFYSLSLTNGHPDLAPVSGTVMGFASAIGLLNQLVVTFAFSAIALLLIVAAVYFLRPKTVQPTAPNAAAAADFLHAAYQPRTAAPLRGYRPAEAPRPASAWASNTAKINKAEPAATAQPAQPFKQPEFKRTLPPQTPRPSLVPTPLALQAENLLKQAHTIPNFATTPLPGQRRVLTKLADNFVPAPQRGAALSLALFRLRSPSRAA